MKTIEAKATAIADKISDKVNLDPLTLAAIIGFLVEIVNMFQQCKATPKETVAEITSPTLFTRLRLRRLINAKKSMSKELKEGLHPAVLEVMADVTEKEVTAMFSEAKK